MKMMYPQLLLSLCVALTACFANVTDGQGQQTLAFREASPESGCFETTDLDTPPARAYVDAMTCGEFGSGFSNPPGHFVVKQLNEKRASTEVKVPDADAYERCVDLSRNGMLIMQARQGGLDKARLISASGDPGFHQAVHAVYSVPRESTKQRQDEVANRFALDLLTECLRQQG